MKDSVKRFADSITRDDIRGLSYPMLYDYYLMWCVSVGVPDSERVCHKNFGSNLTRCMPGYTLKPHRNGTSVTRRFSFEDEHYITACGTTPAYMALYNKVYRRNEE